MLEGVAYSWGWKFVTWLPGYLLRVWWSKEALAARIRIDLRPRHSPVQINAGPEITRADIWLEVQNSSPFPVELDRMTVTLYLAGSTIDYYHLERVTLRPDSRTEFHVDGYIPPGHIAHYARNYKAASDPVALDIHADFNSKIRNFAVHTGTLTGIQARNINLPQS
jgi:hypothetical protein